MPKKVSDAEILRAYRETGSVWKAGDILGISGQTVSRRMRGIKAVVNKRWLTDDHRAEIRAHYEAAGDGPVELTEIAFRMGRTRNVIARAAGEMGLTDIKRPKNEALKAGNRKPKWQDKPHPRGALGLKHSDETKASISNSLKDSWTRSRGTGKGWDSPEFRQAMSNVRAGKPLSHNGHHRSKKGRREDLGNVFFRSTWEANYARYLNLLIKMGIVEKWDFEPETFWFLAIKRGVRSYLPDFRVFYKGDPKPVYVEIKGYFDAKSKTKLSRMAKYHPSVKIELVDSKAYAALRQKWKSAIPNWE